MLRVVAAVAIAVGLAGSTAAEQVAVDESDDRLNGPAATVTATGG